MKKIIISVIVFFLLIGVVYIGYERFARKPQLSTATPKTEEKGVFSTIQDALTKSLSLQCNFSEDADHQVTAYIKNGAVREDIVAKNPNQSGSAIIKDKKMYYWTKDRGFVLALKEEDIPSGAQVVTPTDVPPMNSTSDASSFMAVLEKFKSYCKPAVVADSVFVPPANVVFQDMTKMMQQPMMKPSVSPTGMSEEQMKEMMQQYQTTPSSGQ